MNDTGYSVLMSVYYKEKAEYLRASMESMYNQTIPTDDFVLVCDGKLNDRLEGVIGQMQGKFGDVLHVLRIDKNSGLGNALNAGIKQCKHELVARMDSDDISMKERCERQLKMFRKDKDLDIVSGTVLEFADNISNIIGRRECPAEHQEICKFSRRRNPFNHPAVMFKKSAVEEAGGYREDYHLFEDYYLWVRMLKKGSKALNCHEAVLYMRAPSDLYLRRGGRQYALEMLRFHCWMYQVNWSTLLDFLSAVIPHGVVCMLPNRLRGMVYSLLHS